MAKSAPLGQLLIVNGVDLSGDVGSISEMGIERETLDVTPINKSAHERLIGQTSGVIDFDSFFNDSSTAEAQGSHDQLKSMPSGDRIVIWAKGSTVGDTAAAIIAKQMNFAMNRAADGALTQQSRFESNGFPLEFGTMLTGGIDTHASASSSASVDNGASSASGLSAYLAIKGIGSGTPTVTIEMDADDSWNGGTTTAISFTEVADGGEPTAERKTTTGTIQRYLRVTTTGTFTDLDFAIFIRRGTANDAPGIIT